jgi:hypothetical protein
MDHTATKAAAYVYPHQPADLTTEWLTGALRSAGFDGVVADFAVRDLGEGVGMMGVVCMIELTYASGTGPTSVIGKFATTIGPNLAISLHFDIYRREVVFYQDIAPLTSVTTPRIHFAEIAGPDDFIMLMEDMTAYRRGDQVLGCTPAEAVDCMEELVKLHAPFWDQVDTPLFEFTFRHAPSAHSTGMCQAAIDSWPNMDANFGAYIPAAMTAAKETFLAAVPQMQLWIASDPITFVHGDYRMDNLMLGTAPDHAPIVSLDWQGVLRSKGIQDVAYLLSQSMSPDDRRTYERALVGQWQRGLTDAGVRNYSAEQAWEDYRRAVLYLWVYVTVIAGGLDPGNDRGRQFMSGMITRSGAAIMDLDCLSLLGEFES